MQLIGLVGQRGGGGVLIFSEKNGPRNSKKSVTTNAVVMQSILRLYVRNDIPCNCSFDTIHAI